MSQRLEYDKPLNYSSKVLIGTWINERLESEAKTQPGVIESTTYGDHFGPKPISRIDPAVIWDQKCNSEESNFISQIGRDDFPNYFENFTSTYDLSYNHYPKCFKGHIPRTLNSRKGIYEPMNDYIPSFGNMTKYGLLDYKKEQWGCELQDPRRNLSTHYTDTFMPPETKDYQFRRFATPRANSSILDNVNVLVVGLKLRGRPNYSVPPPHELVQVPKPSAWNPITWEWMPDKSTEIKQ